MQCAIDKRSGTSLWLIEQLGAGVQGSVYRTRDGQAVKVFHTPTQQDPRFEKVNLLTKLMEEQTLPIDGFAWPLGIVLDHETRQLVGYRMRLANGKSLSALSEDRELADIPLPSRVAAAHNLASTVRAFHAAPATKRFQIAMPDLAAQNILWDTVNHHVTILDTDSFSCRFRGPRGMVTDLGLARTPGISPRELLADPNQSPNSISDCYSFATLVFTMIFGRAPTDVKPGPGVPVLDGDEAVRQRIYPLYRNCGYDPPSYIVSEDNVPDDLHQLWFRAFLQEAAQRPTADEFASAFQAWSELLQPKTRRLRSRSFVAAGLLVTATGIALASGRWSRPSPTRSSSTNGESPSLTKSLGNALLSEVLK